ncbi:MAG: hypothetical protein JSV03_05970, partial [Planctomycetota bacterium]
GIKRGSPIFGITAVICYGLAIGCRENAILFPVVCVAGDWLCGTSRRKGIRWEHAAMIGILVAYMVMRYVMLGGFPVPRKPYWMPISDPEFPVFIVQKVILYMLGLFGAVPAIPMGGRAFFTTRTTAFYGGFAALIAILLLILAVYRFRKSLLWPFVWAGVLIAPMLPVFASAHHLYLPSLGMVLLYTAGLAAIGGVLRPAGYRMGRMRAWMHNLLLLVIAMALGTATWCSGFAYVRGTMAEDMLVDDVITRGEPIEEGDHLFFINLPPVCYYVVPAIKAELGLNQLNGHVLTCSPELVRMELSSEVELIDEHTLRVNSGPDQRYFEGITGQSLLAMMGFDGMPKQGETVDAGLFTVTPTIVDDRGVRELIFTFTQPLNSPNYHFYFGSPRFMAYPLSVSKRNVHNN